MAATVAVLRCTVQTHHCQGPGVQRPDSRHLREAGHHRRAKDCLCPLGIDANTRAYSFRLTRAIADSF